jgi:hypothetical protein
LNNSYGDGDLSEDNEKWWGLSTYKNPLLIHLSKNQYGSTKYFVFLFIRSLSNGSFIIFFLSLFRFHKKGTKRKQNDLQVIEGNTNEIEIKSTEESYHNNNSPIFLKNRSKKPKKLLPVYRRSDDSDEEESDFVSNNTIVATTQHVPLSSQKQSSLFSYVILTRFIETFIRKYFSFIIILKNFIFIENFFNSIEGLKQTQKKEQIQRIQRIHSIKTKMYESCKTFAHTHKLTY